MLIGAFQVLQAKRDQIDAGQSYVLSLRDYWTARVELDQILAGRFVRSDRPILAPTLELKRSQSNGAHS